MEQVNITYAKYTQDESGMKNNGVLISIDNGNIFFVPLDPANRQYAEILRQVEAGTITIADAE
jgi:hypothetical protein